MNTNRMVRLLLVIALSQLLVGCMARPIYSRTPNLDENFGMAVETARAQQTINPNASRNTDPVTGLDGRAGREAVERYEASFQRPPPPANVFSIGVSGNSGSTQ